MEPSKTLLAPPDVNRFCVLLTHSEVVGASQHTIITVWMLSTFLFTILYPINLFILARILFHGEHMHGGTDYYKGISKNSVYPSLLEKGQGLR